MELPIENARTGKPPTNGSSASANGYSLPGFESWLNKPGRELPEKAAARHAEVGAFDEILKLLADTSLFYDRRVIERQLFQALKVAAEQKPVTFQKQMFEQMVSLGGHLTCLLQAKILNRVLGEESRHWLGDGFISESWAQLIEQQLALADLLDRQASTARKWRLAKNRKSSKNGRSAFAQRSNSELN